MPPYSRTLVSAHTRPTFVYSPETGAFAMLSDWSTLPAAMHWRQDEARPLSHNLYAGTRTIGSMTWGDPEGGTGEATLREHTLRLAWRGVWRRQLYVHAPADPAPLGLYRPNRTPGGGGTLALANTRHYRWKSMRMQGIAGCWDGPGLSSSPVFGNVSDGWNIQTEITLPRSTDRSDALTMLTLVGSFLALTDALGQHTSLIAG